MGCAEPNTRLVYFRSRAHALRMRKVHVCVVVLCNHTSGLAQPHFRLVGPRNRDLISGESRMVNHLRRIDSVWVYWTYLPVSVARDCTHKGRQRVKTYHLTYPLLLVPAPSFQSKQMFFFMLLCKLLPQHWYFD